ncbi:M56 family metallopeptidase [Oceanicaulis sp. MMSF_3324]|uniref:M56 family metallopeptidase n=1 Tax=Oceanicaulis sp. MMSF_3324 TaxID=3046702 RepID=UPI00273F4938|nr:M56 family metallopeptidase [Oceanicaulis sp. MMSF_3324]
MTLIDLIWTSAATLPATLSAWLAARALEPHLSSRLGVRLWQAARLAAFAPILVVLGAGLIPQLQSVNAPGVPVTLQDGAQQAVPVAAPLFQPVLDFAELTVSSVPTALLPLIAVLYLAGLAVMAARGVMQRSQIRTLIRASIGDNGRLSEFAHRWRAHLGLPQTLAPVRVVDATISPFVVGIKPVILAPDTLAKRDDAEAAIAHELMHIKRGDERDRLIGEALTALMWFNPVYRAIERRLAAARELACDADVLDAMGPEHRQRYAEAIAGLAPMPAVATGFLTDLERLRRRRVRAALSHTGRKPRMLVAMMAGAAILLAGAPSAALAVVLSGQEAAQGEDRRVLTEAVGEQVRAAQEAAQANDHQRALGILNAIPPTSPYERFVIDQLRARALFELDDLPGSVEAFEAALMSGGANEEERYSVETAIFQLNLVLQDYDAVRQSLQYLTQHDERMTPRMKRTVAQALVQMVEHESALPYAEAARAELAEDDLDLLHLLYFLYQETGREAEMEALRAYLQENHPDSIVLQ